MKWRNLRPVDREQPSWMDHRHLRTVRRLCRKVHSRTGASAWVDTAHAELCFGYPDGTGDARCPLSVRLFRDVLRRCPVMFDSPVDPWSEDEIVRSLRLARLPERVKRRWRDWKESDAKQDASEAAGVAAQEAFGPALAESERAYERHSMGKHYKGRALVSGLKGIG